MSSRFTLLLLGLCLVQPAAAERPWGAPREEAPRSGFEQPRKDGYQGRYNPWGGGAAKPQAREPKSEKHYPPRGEPRPSQGYAQPPHGYGNYPMDPWVGQGGYGPYYGPYNGYGNDYGNGPFGMDLPMPMPWEWW